MTNDYRYIQPVRIREIRSASPLSRLALLRYSGEGVTVRLSAAFSRPDAVPHRVSLRLGARYTVIHRMMERTLLDYEIEVVFALTDETVCDLDVDNDFVTLEPWMARLMLSVGIGALRGMLAVRTAGTMLTHFPLPLMSLDALIEALGMEHGASVEGAHGEIVLSNAG